MARANEYAVGIMEHLVTHDGDSGHGYTWGNRWGNGTIETISVLDKQFQIAGGDRDCSSGFIDAWETAVPGSTGGATYTGNMVSCLLATGKWEKKPLSFIASPGDAYLNVNNHVAMCRQQVPDELLEFCINEFGEVYGGKDGDQTGRESRIGGYYDYPWDCIMHYIGDDNVEGSTIAEKSDAIIPSVFYRVHILGGDWLSWVENTSSNEGDDYAGDDLPIDGVAFDMSGYYRVRFEDGTWSDYCRNEEGILRTGKAITNIEAYYETQYPSETGWLGIKYRVKDENGWMDYMIDDECQGCPCGEHSAGDGTKIIGLQAVLVPVD